MEKKKKILVPEELPEFNASIEAMPEDSRIFVDKSLAIADYILKVMAAKGYKQKDLAERMGKSEAEVSKLLGGMHNYTLRSLSKIEAALGCDIICTPKQVRVYVPVYKGVQHTFEYAERKQPEATPKIQYAKVVKLAPNRTEAFETAAI